MQHAEKIIAILVQRLGGRVEFSPSEIDAMGENGEFLLGYQAGLEFKYVLEVRERGPVELPVMPAGGAKGVVDVIGLGAPEPRERVINRGLADFTSPEVKQWKTDIVETMARRSAGLPDLTGSLHEAD